MTNEHPITPPPELVEQWVAEIWHEGTPVRLAQSDLHLAAAAARWGADQQLEMIIHWLVTGPYGASIVASAPSLVADLRAACRPKPPSLKEQALAVLMNADGADHPVPVLVLPVDEVAIIRRALEALPDNS